MGGSDKQTSNSQQQTTVQQTPTEAANDQLMYQRNAAANPGLIANDQYGLDLSGKLLQGQALPGYLNTLPGGIDTNAQNSIANQSVKMINPYLNQGGIMDSGTAASVGAKTAGDVYRQSQEFNIGNLLNLLNLSSGFSAQIQQPISQNASTLAGSLAGLRGTTSTGNTTTLGMNPFTRSFLNSSGSTLGTGAGGAATGFGGGVLQGLGR